MDALMSFKESVKDLNSNEFRSPPSARHWNREVKSVSQPFPRVIFLPRNKARWQASLFMSGP